MSDNFIGTATYSPEDNKLRLYPFARLARETYQRVKAAGFIWAPKQELCVAPAWSTAREDMLIELCGEIGDEDTGLVDRTEERASRFEGYSENRRKDAAAAHRAVDSITHNIPFGQPILIGHHSEKRARRDAEKIDNGMRKAVKMWECSKYWEQRAAGAIRAAKYKERPDVRARRIKGIEADLRKTQRSTKSAEGFIELWKRDPLTLSFAKEIADRDYIHQIFPLSEYPRNPPASQYEGSMSLYHALDNGVITPEQARAIALEAHETGNAHRARWIQHYENRLLYERAMLADAGGIVSDRKGPEKGGACRCWASPRQGWSYIAKVNKVSVTVEDNWGNGGLNFIRTIPFDKLEAVMTAQEVQEARESGKLIESEDKTGFWIVEKKTLPANEGQREKPKDNADITFSAMKESLRQGIQTVSVPQLFPTPPQIAAEMVEAAEIEPDHSVLEPSAGTGNLVKAINAAQPEVEICAIEFNQTIAYQLARVFGYPEQNREKFNAICDDFLSCDEDLGKFDRIVMNPPFENGADIKHIKHALEFLKPGGRLVALCANGSRQQSELKELGEWRELPKGSFAESGTMVNVAMLIVEKEQESFTMPLPF